MTKGTARLPEKGKTRAKRLAIREALQGLTRKHKPSKAAEEGFVPGVPLARRRAQIAALIAWSRSPPSADKVEEEYDWVSVNNLFSTTFQDAIEAKAKAIQQAREAKKTYEADQAKEEEEERLLIEQVHSRPVKETAPDEILRDFERWTDGGSDWREILLNARIVVDYYNTPKGKPKTESKAIGRNLNPKIKKLRQWGDAAPSRILKKMYNTWAEQLDGLHQLYASPSAKFVDQQWYGASIRDLVDSIKVSGEKHYFSCAARLLKYLGAFMITREAVREEYRRSKRLATK